MTDLPSRAPGVTPDTEEFWEATTEDRLLLSQCPQCTSTIWYPRAYCPHCEDVETEWVESGGQGAIYSYSIAHGGVGGPFGEATPYVIAYVELSEGPRLMTNIVNVDDFDELSVGYPVEVVFHETEGDEDYKIPRFEPV